MRSFCEVRTRLQSRHSSIPSTTVSVGERPGDQWLMGMAWQHRLRPFRDGGGVQRVAGPRAGRNELFGALPPACWAEPSRCTAAGGEQPFVDLPDHAVDRPAPPAQRSRDVQPVMVSDRLRWCPLPAIMHRVRSNDAAVAGSNGWSTSRGADGWVQLRWTARQRPRRPREASRSSSPSCELRGCSKR